MCFYLPTPGTRVQYLTLRASRADCGVVVGGNHSGQHVQLGHMACGDTT